MSLNNTERMSVMSLGIKIPFDLKDNMNRERRASEPNWQMASHVLSDVFFSSIFSKIKREISVSNNR